MCAEKIIHYITHRHPWLSYCPDRVIFIQPDIRLTLNDKSNVMIFNQVDALLKYIFTIFWDVKNHPEEHYVCLPTNVLYIVNDDPVKFQPIIKYIDTKIKEYLKNVKAFLNNYKMQKYTYNFNLNEYLRDLRINGVKITPKQYRLKNY